jgi:hypothetical protein
MPTTTTLVPSSTLTVTQFQHLADVPPEIEWFANLTNANTRRAYQQDLADWPCTCTLRIITTGLPGRPSQRQKGLDGRALMASQRPSPPW